LLVENNLEAGVSLHSGPAAETGGGLFTRDFEKRMKGALGVELLSLREFCEENLEDA
jgi:hypothetical protein